MKKSSYTIKDLIDILRDRTTLTTLCVRKYRMDYDEIKALSSVLKTMTVSFDICVQSTVYFEEIDVRNIGSFLCSYGNNRRRESR